MHMATCTSHFGWQNQLTQGQVSVYSCEAAPLGNLTRVAHLGVESVIHSLLLSSSTLKVVSSWEEIWAGHLETVVKLSTSRNNQKVKNELVTTITKGMAKVIYDYLDRLN